MKKLFILGLVLLSKVVSAHSNQQIYNWIIQTDIKHPKIVYAQYIQETGGCKSKACTEKNNLFGFMYKGKIMFFESKLDCVLYYKRWQQRKYKGGDYYQFLIDINYASDPLYIQRLKQIVKSL
jgi:flagellum-specific peptidoglycan hydrolase FlgJ